MSEFNLKIHQLKEGKIYEVFSGGFVTIQGSDILTSKDGITFTTDVFTVTVSDTFKESHIKKEDSLRDMFTKMTSDNLAANKDRNLERLLGKLVDEIEALKK